MNTFVILGVDPEPFFVTFPSSFLTMYLSNLLQHRPIFINLLLGSIQIVIDLNLNICWIRESSFNFWYNFWSYIVVWSVHLKYKTTFSYHEFLSWASFPCNMILINNALTVITSLNNVWYIINWNLFLFNAKKIVDCCFISTFTLCKNTKRCDNKVCDYISIAMNQHSAFPGNHTYRKKKRVCLYVEIKTLI